MDAIIGRYKVSLEDIGLILKHPTGIIFDLTIEETLALRDFLNIYHQTLLDAREEMERQTDPSIKAIVLHEDGD